MQIIAHRINTIEQLSAVPHDYGIELDIRYHNNDLILHHDPFGHNLPPYPCHFETLLQNWKHSGPMILNVKTEGIEMQCIGLMKKYGIKSWFFLDLSMPYFAIYAYNDSINNFTAENLAVRFSEREPVEYALAFAGKAGWVWVDCFTRFPLDHDTYKKLKNAGFRICIVAPELQKHPAELAVEFQKEMQGMEIDAVCTKRPELWL